MPRSVSEEFIREGDINSVLEIKYVNGGWITVPDSASLAAIDSTRGADGQIAYVQDEGLFYIVEKVPGLVDIFTGTVITEEKFEWTVLPFSGSFSGSFQGDGSGLTGVGGVPGGSITQLQFHSASGEEAVFGGAEVYYISSSGNLGVGISNPTAKLHVDGNAIITGTLTAQEFHTEFVSASIIYQSGSTKFGDTADDLHSFTGSVNIAGRVTALGYTGSFSGSFSGDGSQLTGIASTLALSGSTGNDLVNLKTDALKITGSARNIDVAVTDNTATVTVPNNLRLTDVELTGSFRGAFAGTFSGSVDAVIENAVTASYVLNAVSASYALTSSYALTATSASHALNANNSISASFAATTNTAISASHAITASYVPGYVRDSGGQTDEIAIWSSTDQISGSQAFFVSRSYGGNVSTILDGYYYAENNGGFVAHSAADGSGSKSTIGMYDPGTGTAIIYAGSGSGQVVGAIKFAVNELNQAYAIGTNISPNKANTLRIEPTVELLAGMSGSFSGSFYGRFVGLIDSASYAVFAATATSASYSLTSTSASYALTSTTASYALTSTSASYALTSTSASYALRATSASYASTSTSASYAITASYAPVSTTAATASYFTGSWIDFTPLADASAPAYKNGRLWYGSEDGALNFYNEEADITLQIGQEFYVRVFNPTTSSIANGTPVLASGSQGDRITVYPALAEDHTTGAHFDSHILGLATHTIEGSSEGYVTAQGVVRGVNTSAFAAGDIVYLQTGSAGLRNTPPPFPYDIVQVGYVARSAANGFIFVEPKEPVHFSNISGLSGSGAPANKDLWVFNAANNGWYNTHSGLELSGSFSGSFSGTVDRAISSSHAVQADNALTSVTSSFALVAESVTQLNQDVIINGNLSVYGTSSLIFVTSSQLDVDSAFISVNVFEPVERFGGMRVYDSGSSDATASLAWDSLHNHWVYQNSSGSTYSGGMFMSGPRNTGSLGDEPGLTKWYVARSDGGDHLNDTQIYSSASNTVVYGDLFTTGTTSGSFAGNGSGLFGVAANPAGVDKSVQFKSGSVTGGATNFFFDHTTARVGIGTASPTTILDINGVADAKGYSVNGNYASFADLPDAGMYAANVSFDDGFGALLITSRVDAARAIAFGTNNGTSMGERMRITGVGRVGIGTTSPAALLTVSNTTDNGAAVRVQRTNALSGSYTELGTVGGSGRIESFNGNLTIGADASNTDSNSVIQFKVDNSEKVRIDTNGSVGVGTTAPAQLLHVYGRNSIQLGTTGEYLRLTSADGYRVIKSVEDDTDANNGYGRIEFRNNGSKSTGLANGGYHFIADSGSVDTSLVRILNNGNVGIGTASPGSKLTVNGPIESLTDNGGEGGQLILRGPVYRYNLDNYSGSRMRMFREDDASAGSGAELFSVSGSGALKANFYGSGTFTGTAAKSLAVDSSGNVIEIDVSSNGTGVANEVAFWKDTDTVSGSQALTWDGTTLSINGVLEANEKSFVIDHPTQPGKKLVYGVLEGPEHAVYCRGKISGNVIELPEEWTGLVDEDSITVQLTSIGKHQNLYVVDIRDNKVFIKNGDLLTSKINAYYYIQGTRKDTKPLQTVRDK